MIVASIMLGVERGTYIALLSPSGMPRVMMRAMRTLKRWMFVPIVLLSQAMALADDSGPPIDARLEGFPKDTKVVLDGGGVAGSWIIFIILGVICVAFLFMNAKRSHLD